MKSRLNSSEIVNLFTAVTSYNGKWHEYPLSRKLSNCKNVRQACNLKSRDRSSMEKGRTQEVKVREVGEQGTVGGRFRPPVPPTN